MVGGGEVTPWAGAIVVKKVRVDLNDRMSWMCTPDLVLVHPTRGLGVVECKRAADGGSKHGMFEQVILYCELIRRLKWDGFMQRLRGGVPLAGGGLEDAVEVLSPATGGVLRPAPVVVVDRWGKSALRTSALSRQFLNEALSSLRLPSIEVWAIGCGKPELVPWAAPNPSFQLTNTRVS